MRSAGAIVVLTVSLFPVAAPRLGAAGGDVPRLRLTAEYELQGARSPAFDVRWATHDTVFLTTALDQVAEHRLTGGLPTVRQLYPSPPRLDGGMVYWHLAVSEDALVVASAGKKISWRPVAPNPGGAVQYERRMLGHVADVDLQGDRLAWIGWPEEINRTQAPDLTGIAWSDRLSDHLESPHRLLSDTGSDPGEGLDNCAFYEVGAVRFQPDRSLLLVLGFSDDVVLLDPAGRRLRRWDARWFGVDTAAGCARITPEQRQHAAMRPRAVQEWANRHTVFDEALATPRGPALVVRRMEDGLPAWRLHLLGPAGVESYDLPVRATSPFDRLAGDSRGSKLVLLVGDMTDFPRAGSKPDRVLVVDLGPMKAR